MEDLEAEFMEARELLSDAEEALGTTYFDDDLEDAKEATEKAPKPLGSRDSATSLRCVCHAHTGARAVRGNEAISARGFNGADGAAEDSGPEGRGASWPVLHAGQDVDRGRVGAPGSWVLRAPRPDHFHTPCLRVPRECIDFLMLFRTRTSLCVVPSASRSVLLCL